MYRFVYLCVEYDYERIVYESDFQCLGCVYQCDIPKDALKGVKRFIYRIHNNEKVNEIINIPFKNIWASSFISKDVKKHFNATDKICFIFLSNWFRFKKNMLFEHLRNMYPNCVLVCALSDIVNSYVKFKEFNIDELTSTFDLVCTYNAIDAQKYGFCLAPARLFNYDWVESDESIPESDVFFVGLNKKRLDMLFKVYEICTRRGLKCDFYISNVDNYEMKYADKIIYNKRISYEEVLKRCKKTKCIVNLIQDGAEGITLRDQEAIGMNKCLITDNVAMINSDFYTKEKVIWFDNIETEIDKIFYYNENVNWNGIDRHSALNYYQWLEYMIDKIKHTEEL